MADDDDIDSYWEGLRPPPLPFKDRVRQAVETGFSRARAELEREERLINPFTEIGVVNQTMEAQRQAILQGRLGEIRQRRFAPNPEEPRPSLEQVLTAADAGPGAEAQIEALARYPLQRGASEPRPPQWTVSWRNPGEPGSGALSDIVRAFAYLGIPIDIHFELGEPNIVSLIIGDQTIRLETTNGHTRARIFDRLTSERVPHIINPTTFEVVRGGEARVNHQRDLIERVEPGTGDPIEPDEDPGLFALDETSTEAHLTTLHQVFAALGFPTTIELSRDTGTIYLTFPPSLDVETQQDRSGETTVIINR